MKKSLYEFLEQWAKDKGLHENETRERFKGLAKGLDDLTKRLQDDYNGVADFEQRGEDRLIAYSICEFLDWIDECLEEDENNNQ